MIGVWVSSTGVYLTTFDGDVPPPFPDAVKIFVFPHDVRQIYNFETGQFGDIPSDPAPDPYINNGGIARFSGGSPAVLLENIRMAAVSRVSKGRYRVYHEEPYPTDQYSVTPSLFDTNPRVIKVTARTPTYVEVRTTDFANVAQDVAEATVKTERVITS